VNQRISLLVGVINHEGGVVPYRVALHVGGQPPFDVGGVSLADKKEWQEPVEFQPQPTPGSQRVELQLYKGTDPNPYRTLHLTLEVASAPAQAPP
jgi:uncharacterized membrane protein